MQDNCTGNTLPGSFDSSGGAFQNGYCIWKGTILISSHCKEGYNCGGGPPKDYVPRFEGECVKIGCSKSPTMK
ncbi:hypothetical protein Mal48_48390 [Thalassoglobus polymorphus]|uniref:Uncharacterized protein n=1 Tax=Thalassoglobus polymorphus TaxID=2527994 RepID=A0A517QVE2_9PLAN|nr:hypothetical protein Mal48_48390 [Thalassoglobus polymorphus]